MNYLIFRNDGIGDLILSTPLILAIRNLDPKSKIYLISSMRNNNFAEMLLKDGLIDEVYLRLTRKDNGQSNLYELYKKLSKISFEDVFLLKGSTSNLLFSKMLKAENIFSIISINEGKIFKSKYSPPLFSKFFLKGIEFIDCRNNYMNSSHLHMSVHFLNLIRLKYNKEISLTNKYHLPKYLDKYRENYIKILNSKYNFDIDKNIIIFHLDEKWNNYNHSFSDIKNCILNLSLMYKSTLIITNGLIENKHESKIMKEFDLKIIDTNENIYTSSINKDIIFLPKLTIEKIFFIIELSNLVITPHGSLTHIASLYNKNLIDLIPFEQKDFFLKWKSDNVNSTQFEIKNLKGVEAIASKYLKA